MRLTVLATLLLTALAGCTDEGLNPIVSKAIDEVNPFHASAPKPGAPVTRAQIDRADVATIRARLVSDKSPTFLVAAANNGGYITYASGLRQLVVMRNSQVTGTRGLGHDLLSAKSTTPDPLATPMPVSQWPALVQRSYEFPANAPRGEIETFDCRFERGPVKEMVILDQPHRGQEVSEYCEGPTGSFEQLHFADLATGFVWRTLSWLGPRQGLIDIEIVLPYTGSPR
ncbi:YjbF family lipoprotein [Amaricoccus solimangrovi]|uniref:YjbF family lipoprotein n=1 Tax=Amaricoccus solimangrovi TaxID=2589815 RepID=A0A501WWJ7_9RHOB|nr:YjbF family lipoprotein [Amaricoccus solimangrovi]TPE52625.1 YjbF family lipoprotein [Amaricoccus solimangrovi]